MVLLVLKKSCMSKVEDELMIMFIFPRVSFVRLTLYSPRCSFLPVFVAFCHLPVWTYARRFNGRSRHRIRFRGAQHANTCGVLAMYVESLERRHMSLIWLLATCPVDPLARSDFGKMMCRTGLRFYLIYHSKYGSHREFS